MGKGQKKTVVDPQQLSLFDTLLKEIGQNTVSSTDIGEMLKKLEAAKKAAREREEAERRRRKAEEERRKEAEKKERERMHVEAVTCMDLPLTWENAFCSDERVRGVHAESVSDALVLCLANLGKVDIEYIAAITGETYKTVIGSLDGSIYQNPENWNECFYKGWETADEYLSGNLMRKWQAAEAANKKYHGYFAENLRAIEAVLPPTVATKDIYVTLGSPWVPTDIIDDFIAHLFKRDFCYLYKDSFTGREINAYAVVHDPITGTWEIPNKTRGGNSVTDKKTYGTERLGALYILEKTLNMKSVAVTDEVACLANASGKKRVLNQGETVLALEKQQKLIAEFQNWVWQDEKRKERLEIIFENQFSCVRRRIFDGSFLSFPTLSPDVSLYPYQKNAVARILFTRNTLLAHDVGSGKTYVMIAAGMELRRMGLSEKNLYVVPNNIVGQWEQIFRQMYPQAKLLIVEPKNFTPGKRGNMLKKIRDGSFDGIVMSYSCFEQIPLSQQYYVDTLQDALAKIKELREKQNGTTRLRKHEEKLRKQLSEISRAINKLSDDVYFDELGITRLFVDEAHNYKNVPLETKTDKVLGISGGGSKKCQDMLDKVRTVQRQDGGVVFATGTPITNSVTDAFIMQKYLQNGELGLLDLQNFDSWIGMFAERSTEFEIDVDTSGYRLATRFSKFHNLPELTALLSQIADFHRADETNGLPQLDGYTDALVAKTSEFAAYLKQISARADDIRHGRVFRTMDNMLKLTTDGRQAALDLRLVDPNAAFTWQSKAARCAENVAEIHRTTDGTQLIFCDSSTPKAGFNLYDELRRLLTGMGVPGSEIAYVHDAATEAKRTALFRAMREGKIRILIGSTFKLGLGVNVQDKLIALHHLDVPWRPADMTQREGRILRQGNRNPRVQIFRYITEGSFDAYSWQLLETKQRFITGLLSGSYDQRDGADIEDTVLNFAEVKALAVGNPLVKKRVEKANELSRYLTLQHKTVEARLRLEAELQKFPSRLAEQDECIQNARADLRFYHETLASLPVPVTTAQKTAFAEKRKALRERLYAAILVNERKPVETPFEQFRGFQIVLPANMQKEKPFLWLQKTGRYYVELGDSAAGYLTRIGYFLEHLDAHIAKMEETREKLVKKGADIRAELAKKESFADEIKALTEEIEAIDKKLGVKKK